MARLLQVLSVSEHCIGVTGLTRRLGGLDPTVWCLMCSMQFYKYSSEPELCTKFFTFFERNARKDDDNDVTLKPRWGPSYDFTPA